MKARRFCLLACCFLIAATAQAQERPVVSLGELIETLDEAMDITEAALEFRARFSNGLSAPDFASAVADLQRRCEPILMLIVETRPPREVQRFAMIVAMGVKAVELGLWHYLYGLMSAETDYIDSGDQLLNRARSDLFLADRLAAEVR